LPVTFLAKAVDYWRGFSSGSVNRRIFYAMTIITAGTLVVKVAAVLKDIVIAGSFGLGDEVDAFLLALVIPTFAVMVLAQSFNGAFMPAYIRIRERESVTAANRLFGHVMVLSFCILLACTGVLALSGEPLLGLLVSEISSGKRALVHELYLILLPFLLQSGQLHLWASVLNAGEKFALVALAPVLTPAIVIALLLLSGTAGVDIRVVAWATVLGSAAELAVIGFALARRGLLPKPRWNAGMREAGEVARQYLPLVLSAVLMSGSTVIDQVMASWLGSGSVAALNFGNKIPAFLSGIGITALGTAVLPHFSRLVAIGDHAALRHTIKTYARLILLITVPVTAAFIVSSEWLVRLVFERGAFHHADTLLVARIQQMYLLQVPFFVLGILGVRVLVAMSKNHLLTIMALVNLVVNVIGNLVFMRWFGVSGIALSTSVVYIVSMSMILVLLARSLAQLGTQKLPAIS
jgi:putative peptidoglycan lipid II flippase